MFSCEIDFGAKLNNHSLGQEEVPNDREVLNFLRTFSEEDVGTEKEKACYEYLKNFPYLLNEMGYKSHWVIEKLIEENPYHIQYVENPTEDVCLKMVRIDPDSFHEIFYQDPLQLIEKHLTPRICWEAIRQNPKRIQYVPIHHLSNRLILEVLKDYPFILNDIQANDREWLKELAKSDLDEWLLANFLNRNPLKLEDVEIDDEFKIMAFWLAETYREELGGKLMKLFFNSMLFRSQYEFRMNSKGQRLVFMNQKQENLTISELIVKEPMALLWLTKDEMSYRLARYAMVLHQPDEPNMGLYSPYHLLDFFERSSI